MKVYVGYLLLDYCTPICIGLNKEKVEKRMKDTAKKCVYPNRQYWVDEIELKDNKVVEFEDC